ncbi:MAG: TolC family protein, partial [Verrucomicrobiota bacterium]
HGQHYVRRGHHARLSLLLIVSMVMTSCMSVGPQYRVPELDVQECWASPIGAPVSLPVDEAISSTEKDQTARLATEKWWSDFTDSNMDQLIEIVREKNPTLHRAKARIDEVWAQRNVFYAGYRPSHNFTGDYLIGIGEFGEGLEIDPGEPVTNFAQVNHGWEVDIFGKRRRMVESRERDLEAQVEGWRDSYVFFTANVATHYVDVRVAQTRYALTKKKTDVFAEIEQVTKELRDSDFASDVDVEQSIGRTLLEKSKLNRLKQEQELAELTLARICALQPSQLRELVGCSQTIPLPSACITAPFPAQVLRTRPDVRRAERKIAMQVSEIGAEIGTFYPEFRFRGAITYESIFNMGVEELLRHTIGGGPRVFHQLDHMGINQARLAEEKAQLEKLVRTYEEQVLLALMEVEASLATIHHTRKEIVDLEKAVNAQNNAADALFKGYKAGLVDLERLMRAQRERFDATEQLLFARNLLAKSAVALYEATGGGVIPNPPRDSAPMPAVTENVGDRKTLATLLSLGKDQEQTLHGNEGRHHPMNRKWVMTEEGVRAPEEYDDWIMTADGLRLEEEPPCTPVPRKFLFGGMKNGRTTQPPAAKSPYATARPIARNEDKRNHRDHFKEHPHDTKEEAEWQYYDEPERVTPEHERSSYPFKSYMPAEDQQKTFHRKPLFSGLKRT